MDAQAKRFSYWQWSTIIATMLGYTFFYFLRKNSVWPCLAWRLISG